MMKKESLKILASYSRSNVLHISKLTVKRLLDNLNIYSYTHQQTFGSELMYWHTDFILWGVQEQVNKQRTQLILTIIKLKDSELTLPDTTANYLLENPLTAVHL